ncbi:MAG: PEP-CTERM sorting domain-containing protein [Phycisphaerales bacterium]|nr:PEP-CTERM sorting domain-containing protein [Phycisphaerales bacterium]
MKLRSTMLLLGVAGMLGFAIGSQPVNGATITVFQDNFENTTTPLPHIPDAPQAGSYPTGLVAPQSKVIAAGVTPGSPAGGSNILEIANKNRNYGTLSSSVLTSQTITFEWDANIASGTALQFALIGDQGATSLDGFKLTTWVQLNSSGTVQYYNSKWNTITGLSVTPDTWQHYVMEYAVGTGTFTLKAGNNQSGALSLNGVASASQITNIAVTGGSNGNSRYVDNLNVTAVPEPASMALFGVVSAVGLRRPQRHPQGQ